MLHKAGLKREFIQKRFAHKTPKEIIRKTLKQTVLIEPDSESELSP